MSITSVDGIIAGGQPAVQFAKVATATLVAGRPISLFTLAGTPGPGTPNTGLTGANYSSSSAVPPGILYHADPGSGNSYLARFIAMPSPQAGLLLLCDRLWDCGPSTGSTSAQTIAQPTLPARDMQGATNGLGVLLGVEVITAVSSTAAVISVSYTNSAGTSGRTGAFIDLPTAATTPIGSFYRIGLMAGDQGVQSVQSVHFTTDWTSGTIALVAYRVLAVLELPNALSNAIDSFTSGFPQLYNGVCPFLVFIPSAANTVAISGAYGEAQG